MFAINAVVFLHFFLYVSKDGDSFMGTTGINGKYLSGQAILRILIISGGQE